MARLTAQKTVACESLTPVLALPGGLAVCPCWLAGRTVAAQLRRLILHIGLLATLVGRKCIAVCTVQTPMVFTLLLGGSWAFLRLVVRLVPLCKVGTIMPFRDLTHMMKQHKVVTHHHSYPLLCFRFQTLYVSMHHLLVTDAITFK